ncbi:hypothetical protein C8R45DRAFT_1143273 [Mycena sanguinolenta]|nr:hypothetical protein C8R45DRAFT_1143273 [Mycena sanguinolenta]
MAFFQCPRRDQSLLTVLASGLFTATLQVNKSFRGVALTKQLWVHLMNDLISRGLLGSWLTTDLDAYSTTDIIDEIKRVVCGPLTWLPISASPPTLHREFKFFTDLTARAFSDIQLNPGCSHAILTTRDEVHIYEVCTSRCVRKTASKSASISTEVVHGGKMARILLVPQRDSEKAASKNGGITGGVSPSITTRKLLQSMVGRGPAGKPPDHPPHRNLYAGESVGLSG